MKTKHTPKSFLERLSRLHPSTALYKKMIRELTEMDDMLIPLEHNRSIAEIKEALRELKERSDERKRMNIRKVKKI